MKNSPLTYAQAARRIPAKVSAESYQIPYFHGDLNKVVFGNTGRTRPFGWDITVTDGNTVELADPPLPGIWKGAEFRVYGAEKDTAITGANTSDPGKAKATVIIDTATDLNATGHLQPHKDKPSIAVGDLAVLARPSDDTLKISVRLRPPGEPGGIPNDRAAKLRKAITSDPEAKLLVNLTEKAGDFELRIEKGKLVLYGSENRLRTTFEKDTGVLRNLWQHARHRALLQLKGEGGGEFTDNETLKVELVPVNMKPRRDCPINAHEGRVPSPRKMKQRLP